MTDAASVRSPSAILAKKADVEIAFKKFRIPHPRLLDLQSKLKLLRRTGRGSVGEPQSILPVLGPSQSGKSTIIKDFKERIWLKERPAEGHHPVLHVTLESKATVKQLATDVFNALGADGLPDKIVAALSSRREARVVKQGDPFKGLRDPQLMYAVACALRLANVELLVIDEIHHLVRSDKAVRTAWEVTEALKNLAEAGVCPIVIVGVDRARNLVRHELNAQFTSRCDVPVFLTPLDIAVDEELEMFAGFIQALDIAMVKHGLFDCPSELTQGDWMTCFYDVSAGVIGMASRLLRHAATHAIDRNASRVERADLRDATRSWAIPLGITDRDPWTVGPRDLKAMRSVQAKLFSLNLGRS